MVRDVETGAELHRLTREAAHLRTLPEAQVGVVGHLRIGMGSQIAGSSNVNRDVPPGSRWGGTPAKPVRAWFRELTTLARLAERSTGGDEPKA